MLFFNSSWSLEYVWCFICICRKKVQQGIQESKVWWHQFYHCPLCRHCSVSSGWGLGKESWYTPQLTHLCHAKLVITTICITYQNLIYQLDLVGHQDCFTTKCAWYISPLIKFHYASIFEQGAQNAYIITPFCHSLFHR